MSTSKEEGKSSGTTLTDKEMLLLQACFKYGQLDNVDFEKVAAEAGYKDANIAKIMVRRLRVNKIGVKGAVKSDGDTTDAPAPKTPTKPRANRITKSKKTPTKAKARADTEENSEGE